MDWSLHGPAFVISELGYIRNGRSDDEGLLGHYKAGAYCNGGTFTEYYLPEGRDSPRGAGVFASLVAAPHESINQMPFFVNGGVLYRKRPS